MNQPETTHAEQGATVISKPLPQVGEDADLGKLMRARQNLGKLHGLQDAFELARAIYDAAPSREAKDTAYSISQAIFRKLEAVAAEI